MDEQLDIESGDLLITVGTARCKYVSCSRF